MDDGIGGIDPNPVIDELLGLGIFDKRQVSLIREALKDNQRSLIVVAAAFAFGVALGFIGATVRSRRTEGSDGR